MALRRIAQSGVLLALIICACDGPSGSGRGPAPSSSGAFMGVEGRQTVTIKVVGTSDLHGRLAMLPLLGGYIRGLREKMGYGPVLVDAGDMFQGTLESNENEGQAVISAYKAIGYDAVAIGNHEFDYGPVGPASTVRKGAKEGPDRDPRGALCSRAGDAKGAFPMLSANLLENDKLLSCPNVAPSTIVKRQGISIGIIGVSTIATTSTTLSANVIGIKAVPLAEAIRKEALSLRERGVAVVVVAAHAGGQCTNLNAPNDLSTCDARSEIFEVANALPKGLVNVIVAGHTHQSIAHVVAGIAIIQSGAYGVSVGRVDLTVEPKTGEVIQSKIYSPEKLKAGTSVDSVVVEPDKAVLEAIAPAIKKAEAKRAESLGAVVEGEWPAKYAEECALGNWLSSLLLELDPKADVAVLNGGGLRADIAKGPLTYGNFYDVLPFDNRLATMTMTGKTLKSTFRKNLSLRSGILSIAGAKVTGVCDGGTFRVNIALIDRNNQTKELKDDDKVTIVTNEFLATQGDGFGPGENVQIDEEGPPFREPLAQLVMKKGGILKPNDWLIASPRISLPGPKGPGVCKK